MLSIAITPAAPALRICSSRNRPQTSGVVGSLATLPIPSGRGSSGLATVDAHMTLVTRLSARVEVSWQRGVSPALLLVTFSQVTGRAHSRSKIRKALRLLSTLLSWCMTGSSHTFCSAILCSRGAGRFILKAVQHPSRWSHVDIHPRHLHSQSCEPFAILRQPELVAEWCPTSARHP